MELEELKASWSVLNERLEKNELLNKRIIKEMITSRVLTAQQRLLWKGIIGYAIYLACLVFIVFSHTLFGTPLLIVFLICGLLLLSFSLGLPGFIAILKFDISGSLKDSYERILFYQKSMRICYPVIVCLALLLLSFIYFTFRRSLGDREIFIFVSAFLIGLVGSIIEYRWDSSKLLAMKKGVEELKEFKEE